VQIEPNLQTGVAGPAYGLIEDFELALHVRVTG
jgi:hypothetical protein